MKYKFKKLNAKLIYKLYDFEKTLLGDYPGESLRSGLFLKNDFAPFFRRSILKVSLKMLFRNYLIVGEDLPRLFMKGELNENVDYIEMFDILENEGVLKVVEEIDELNLWLVYKDDIKEAIIVDHNEYEGLKILNKELGYEK